eukprot:700294-Hanusia_phi.AAC.1
MPNRRSQDWSEREAAILVRRPTLHPPPSPADLRFSQALGRVAESMRESSTSADRRLLLNAYVEAELPPPGWLLAASVTDEAASRGRQGLKHTADVHGIISLLPKLLYQEALEFMQNE